MLRCWPAGDLHLTRSHSVGVTRAGVVDLDRLRAMLDGAPPALVSIMLANNETGAIQPVAEAAAIVHAAGGLLHVDAIQALGKIPFDLASTGADLADAVGAQDRRPQGCRRRGAGRRGFAGGTISGRRSGEGPAGGDGECRRDRRLRSRRQSRSGGAGGRFRADGAAQNPAGARAARDRRSGHIRQRRQAVTKYRLCSRFPGCGPKPP